MSRLREHWSDWWPFYLMSTVMLILLPLLIAGSIAEEQKWQQFAAEHACRVVGHMSGSVFNTFSVDAKGNPGIGIGATPDKTGYQCDDGQTYWR